MFQQFYESALWRERRISAVAWTTLLVASAFSGCGGGSDTTSTTVPGSPSAFTVSSYDIKGYRFSWNPVAGASRYEVFEDPDGPGPLPDAEAGGSAETTYSHQLAGQILHERLNASYRVRACGSTGCGAFSTAVVPDVTKAIGYFKASNAGWNAKFGSSIALSPDGLRMAVGAPGDRGNGTGVNASQNETPFPAPYSGAVYVFERVDSAWIQQTYIKASNAEANDYFGGSVTWSTDGSTLAVGAPGEASNARGVNGDQSNNSTDSAGAVYVFHRNGKDWTQEAYLKASNTEPVAVREERGLGLALNEHSFGTKLALSADGSVLAVGSPGENSSSTGVNGNQQDTSARRAGAVYVFTRAAGNWRQQAYLKANNTDAWDQFGSAVAMSSNGVTLAIGAPGESSGNGRPADNTDPDSGAVYVFALNGGAWSQTHYLKSPTAGSTHAFGASLSVSSDGDTLAAGASGSIRAAASRPRAAFVFARSPRGWDPQAQIFGPLGDTMFACSVVLSADGRKLALGNASESGSTPGISTNPTTSPAKYDLNYGAVDLYALQGTEWALEARFKAGFPGPDDEFGIHVALSLDGSTLAVGASGENGASSGIGGDQSIRDRLYRNLSGAVYLY